MTLEYFEVSAKTQKPKAVVIMVHGYGSHGMDLLSLAPEFHIDCPDFHFISVQGPYRCEEGEGYQWFSLARRDEEFTMNRIGSSSEILSEFIDQQLDRFNLEDKNLGVIGFSQGTMMTLYTMLRRKEEALGLLCYSGRLIGGKKLAEDIVSKPPVCLVHGEEDDVVVPQFMYEAQKDLEKCDVEVESHLRPLLSHGIDAMGIEIGKTFFKSCLLK